MGRDILQADQRALGERVVPGHQDTAVPAVAGHHDQVGKQLQRFRGDGEIHAAIRCHFGNLHGRTLVHMQGDIRIALDEGLDGRGQRIARLGVGGGDGQLALAFVGILLGDLLDAFDLAQHLAGGFQDNLARRGHMGQVLARAGENLHAQFILQQAYLLADTRLGGKQALGRSGDIEFVMRYFPDIAQLLQFHANPRVRSYWRRRLLMKNSH